MIWRFSCGQQYKASSLQVGREWALRLLAAVGAAVHRGITEQLDRTVNSRPCGETVCLGCAWIHGRTTATCNYRQTSSTVRVPWKQSAMPSCSRDIDPISGRHDAAHLTHQYAQGRALSCCKAIWGSVANPMSLGVPAFCRRASSSAQISGKYSCQATGQPAGQHGPVLWLGAP